MNALRIAAALALLAAPAALSAQTSPSAYTSGTRYDAAGRVTGTISPDPDNVGSGNPFLAVRNSYDGAGRLLKVESGTLSAWQAETVAPANWTGFTILRTAETQYDAMNRKVRQWVREDAAGTVRTMTEYSYDAVGRLACTAVRMNPAAYVYTLTTLPDACEADAVGSDGPDRIARNVYDAAGQRLQLRVGVDSAESGNDVEAAEATWAYNLNGQIVTVIDGNGNRAQLVYDGHGRQNCWLFPSTTRPSAYNDATQATALSTAGNVGGGLSNGHCATGDFEAYEYDPNGNRTRLRKRDTRRIDYAYDALNRVTSKTYPDGGATAVHYGYDLRNLQLFARYTSTGGEGVTNAWDGFGRMVSSSINLGGTTRTLAYAYDRNGNRRTVTHPDGNLFEYNYDGLGRLGSIGENGATSGSGVAASAGYWPDGNRLYLGRPTGAQTYTVFDKLGRLSEIGHDMAGGTSGDLNLAFTHNPASGIRIAIRSNDGYAWTGHYAVSRAYTTNGLNQYSAAGGAGFTYDANGNLITSPGPIGTETLTYAYDIENRLVQRASSGASPTVTLAYDPLGRLYQLTSSGVTTTFLYDGDALVAEYNGSTLLRRYLHAVGADVPLVWYEGTGLGDRRWLHADERGSIVATTGGSGTVSTVYTYDEYGIPGQSSNDRFRYTGQIWLAELGLYHYKARIYSPTLGRFLQTDPIGYEDQFNLYTYVRNDPINTSDPTGECSTREGREVGICGGSDKERMFIKERIADSDSRISEVEEMAAARGQRIDFGFAEAVEIPTQSGTETIAIEGAGVVTAELADGSEVVVGVYINPTQDTVVSGRIGNRPDTDIMSDAEKAEHEISGHLRDRLSGGIRHDQDNAVRRENEYRARRGDPFVRVGERGRQIPRRRF